MSKLLKDVVEYLNERYDTSMRQISSDMGKGTNFIQQTIKRDNLTIDEEIELAKKIYQTNGILDTFDLFALIKQQSNKYRVAQEQADEFERQLIKVNEENRKLEKHCASLKTTLEHRNKGLSEANRKIKVKDIAIESLNRGINNRQDLYNESQKQRKDLEERLNERSAKNRELEHQIVVLQKKIDEDKEDYVKGEMAQDKEIDRLNTLLGMAQDTIESFKKQKCDAEVKLADTKFDMAVWQKTSKIWKLSFITASLFLVILAMYHAF